MDVWGQNVFVYSLWESDISDFYVSFFCKKRRIISPSWNYAMAEEMSDAYYLSGISLDAGLQ